MTGRELAQRLEQINLSPDQLAEYLNRHQDEVERWLTAKRELPGSLTREIEWCLAVHAREEAMKASGLPPCDWMRQREFPAADDNEGWERTLAENEAHVLECEACQRRKAFAATLDPLPPQPMPAHVRVLGELAELIARVPRWARPAVIGAMAVAALTLFRAILMVVLGRAPLTLGLALMVLAAMGLGAYGGLVGGVAFYLVRDRFRRFGRLGDYLTGIACTYAYLAAFGIPAALFTDEEMFRSGLGWAILLLLGAVFGVIIGHSWFRTTPAVATD